MAYIPTPKDLLWTLNNIHIANPWAVPSGGSVFIFRHDSFEFKTFTIAEKTDVQLNYFTPIITNLLCLGYSETSRTICQGVETTAELLENFFDFSKDDIDHALIEGLRKRPHDERFEGR